MRFHAFSGISDERRHVEPRSRRSNAHLMFLLRRHGNPDWACSKSPVPAGGPTERALPAFRLQKLWTLCEVTHHRFIGPENDTVALESGHLFKERISGCRKTKQKRITISDTDAWWKPGGCWSGIIIRGWDLPVCSSSSQKTEVRHEFWTVITWRKVLTCSNHK